MSLFCFQTGFFLNPDHQVTSDARDASVTEETIGCVSAETKTYPETHCARDVCATLAYVGASSEE